MEMQVASAKVCKRCMELNLVEAVKIQRCSQCNSLYCIEFASAIDPSYCTECLSDISLKKEEVVKTYTKYDDEGNEVASYNRKAKGIKLEGPAWLFAQRKITQMDDNALELAIEYHREILQGMCKEREERRIKKAHRYANMPAPPTTPASTTVATSVRKSKVITSSKETATAQGILAAMQAQGISVNKILEMLQKGSK